ncbi:hypothetical protein PGB90_007875 [Kerria lacca]
MKVESHRLSKDPRKYRYEYACERNFETVGETKRQEQIHIVRKESEPAPQLTGHKTKVMCAKKFEHSAWVEWKRINEERSEAKTGEINFTDDQCWFERRTTISNEKEKMYFESW